MKVKRGDVLIYKSNQERVCTVDFVNKDGTEFRIGGEKYTANELSEYWVKKNGKKN